jgi:hypothetical protein
MNDVGKSRCALSMGWFSHRDDPKVTQLKNNIYNCFNNIWQDVPPNQRLWGSYKEAYNKIRGKGYTKAFLMFNARATNAYKDRTHLVYAANVFMNVGEKIFYKERGIQADEEMYALSVMVQWIWRSAIREGGEVHLYIPSKRMRTLLTDWIDNANKGNPLFR